jgi:glycosyltransferase involved in cell wall biosynthesis
LTVCLFTHDGRRDVLADALASVFDQIDSPNLSEVNVCVTDNASLDGTQELIEGLVQDHGERLRYHRHPRDLGLSRNLLSCVALAQSEYCWILTSDDAIEHGGVARVLELIEAAGLPPGVVVNKANFDVTLTMLADQGADDFYPPEQRRTVQYEDSNEFISDCGLLTSLVSTLIVRREAWLQALGELGGDAFADTTIFPHLPIMARMARRDPRWVWCPAKLVRVRMDNAFLSSDEGWSVDQIHTRLLADMSRMWSVHLGSRSRVRLSLLRRAFRTFAAPNVLRTTAPGGRPLRARLALIRAYMAIFWWLPEYWARAVPALLLAGVTARLRRLPESETLSLDQRLARVDAREAPREVPARHEITIRLGIQNAGSATFSPRQPRAVVIGYRWHDADGAIELQGPPLPLPRALSPGQRLSCDARVLTPVRPGAYRLQIALAQQDVGWFDDRDPQHSCWLPIDVRAYGWTDRPGRRRALPSPS